MATTPGTDLSGHTALPYPLNRGIPSTVSTYSLSIRGNLPIDLYRTPLGQPFRVPDRLAEKTWEDRRSEVMFDWKWKTLKRCALDFRLFSPSNLLNSAEVVAASIRLLKSAGVLELAGNGCVKSYTVRCSWSREPRVDVTLYDLYPHYKKPGAAG